MKVENRLLSQALQETENRSRFCECAKSGAGSHRRNFDLILLWHRQLHK